MIKFNTLSFVDNYNKIELYSYLFDIIMKINQIYCEDCFDFLARLPDKSIDSIITDPPYGIGISKWDKTINIEKFIFECDRVVKNFVVFFGQMPTMINWINEINKSSLKFREHIIWVKRNNTPSRLMRGHESIFIYGNLSNFYCTRGNYEDVKIPGLMFDLITIQSIQRKFSEILSNIRKGKDIKNVKRTFNTITQDEFHDRVKRFKNKSIDLTTANFSNVWSFLPAIYSPGRAQKSITFHPCEKPVILLERLIDMISEPGHLILDPFMGSGSTILACIYKDRDFIGIENDQQYFSIADRRINEIKLLTKE